MYFVFSIYNSFSLILNKFNLVCIIDTVTMVLQSLNICAIYYYSNVMERDCLNMIDNVWNAYLRSFLFCVLLKVTHICIYSLFQLNFKPCICLYLCRYPVILSIENHCSVKQQTVMATYIRSIFGGNTDVFMVLKF